jgi:hypothetical protein
MLAPTVVTCAIAGEMFSTAHLRAQPHQHPAGPADEQTHAAEAPESPIQRSANTTRHEAVDVVLFSRPCCQRIRYLRDVSQS